jgi:hypothetical protein
MSSFADVIFPLHLVSKLSGITLFSINLKDFTTRFSKVDLILVLLTAGMSCYLNTFLYQTVCANSFYHSTIIRTSLPILISGKYLINMLCTVWSILSRNRIAKLLRTLTEADEMVSKSNNSMAALGERSKRFTRNIKFISRKRHPLSPFLRASVNNSHNL